MHSPHNANIHNTTPRNTDLLEMKESHLHGKSAGQHQLCVMKLGTEFI